MPGLYSVYLLLGIVMTSTFLSVCLGFGFSQFDQREDDQRINPVIQQTYEEDSDFVDGLYVGNPCNCLLFAERELVFQRTNTSVLYDCNQWGLYSCGEYCDRLLADEDMDYRARQNACDTIGREIQTQWYIRHQVCGVYGPYQDFLMREDLCCARGRPSFCDGNGTPAF